MEPVNTNARDDAPAATAPPAGRESGLGRRAAVAGNRAQEIATGVVGIAARLSS